MRKLMGFLICVCIMPIILGLVGWGVMHQINGITANWADHSQHKAFERSMEYDKEARIHESNKQTESVVYRADKDLEIEQETQTGLTDRHEITWDSKIKIEKVKASTVEATSLVNRLFDIILMLAVCVVGWLIFKEVRGAYV